MRLQRYRECLRIEGGISAILAMTCLKYKLTRAISNCYKAGQRNQASRSGSRKGNVRVRYFFDNLY